MSTETTPPPPPPAAVPEAPTPAPVAVPEARDDATLRAQALGILEQALKPAEGTAAPEAPIADAPVPPPEEPKTDAKADPLAPRFEQLVKEKAAFRKESEAFQSEREKAKQEAAALEPLRRARESGDVLSALQALGFTFEQATRQAIHGEKVKAPAALKADDEPESLKSVKAEIAELRAWRDEQKKQTEAAQTHAQRESDLSTIRDMAKASGDKYELVLEAKAESAAYEMALRQYAEAGNEWPAGGPKAAVEAALAHVQLQLEEQADALLRSQWAVRRLSSVGIKQEAPRPDAASGQKPPPRTLSNSHVTAPPPRPPNSMPTDAELRASALATLTKG